MTEETTAYFAAFFCLRGDVDNLALDKKGCFGLCDTQGREWICWQVDRGSCHSELESVLTDVPEMQETLIKLGHFNTGGVRVKVIITGLPEPIPWKEQLERLRKQLGETSDEEEEGEEWKRGT
ncbi:MAG: hypothetical protein ACYC0X_23525 [Pirellulaceae bacterium]